MAKTKLKKLKRTLPGTIFVRDTQDAKLIKHGRLTQAYTSVEGLQKDWDDDDDDENAPLVVCEYQLVGMRAIRTETNTIVTELPLTKKDSKHGRKKKR